MKLVTTVAALVAAIVAGCGTPADDVAPGVPARTTYVPWTPPWTTWPTTTTTTTTTTTMSRPTVDVTPPGDRSGVTTTTTTTTSPNTYYTSCDEARAAGAAPLRRGDPGYRTKLDRDGDGVACDD